MCIRASDPREMSLGGERGLENVGKIILTNYILHEKIPVMICINKNSLCGSFGTSSDHLDINKCGGTKTPFLLFVANIF